MINRKLTVFILSLLLTCGIAFSQNQQSWFSTDLLLGKSPSISVPITGFITTWVVTNGGSITLPLRASYTYNMSVDYGDGTVVNVTSNNDPDATHVYTSGDSNRTVTITGTMGAWYFDNGGSKANFRGVSSWEPLIGVSNNGLNYAFYGCASATGFAFDVGNSYDRLTSLYGTWAGCNVVQSFPSINTLTNVTDLAVAWYECSGTTNMFPAISNLTKVTTLQQTWNYCSGRKNGFPYVNSLTNVVSLDKTWAGCSGNTNEFPSVSNLTKVTTLAGCWIDCSGIKTSFPEVNTLTNVTILSAWSGCSGNTNTFPAVSNLTKVTTLNSTWYNCPGIKNGFPEVSALTNCTTLQAAWYNCYGNTNGFPAVSNLVKVTSLQYTWWDCYGSYFSVQSVLGDCLWITGQVKTVERAFYNDSRLTGNGMPLVTAITNSPGYPTGYTVSGCFYNCTNLTDYATIPAAFK